MSDFTTILPADLLPSAVKAFAWRRDELHMRSPNRTDIDTADAAIAGALELARSLMVCGTCGRFIHCGSATVTHRCSACHYAPSRWQHYKEATR